jgi:hypothetical protein
MYYCEGKYCSRRGKCAHHKPDTSGKLQQWLDMSTQSSGQAGTDKNGKPFCIVEAWCGDEAVDYKYFDPVTED